MFPRLLSMLATLLPLAAAAAERRTFEMRVYQTNPGKMEALHQRFRQHTLRLFAKHGITSIGYWTPVKTDDQRLLFVLAYPSAAARETSWKAFAADPEWQAAMAESEKDGKLLSGMESTMLTPTDFSPAVEPATPAEARTFELRTYTTTPGNQERLLSRFRDHTAGLFARHGMQNFGYWTPLAGQPGADNKLIYLLAHRSEQAAAESFKAFRTDPEWTKAKTASEAAAGGSLTTSPDGVLSLFLKPTDYSPTK